MKKLLYAVGSIFLALGVILAAQDAATLFQCPTPFTGNICLGAGDRDTIITSGGAPRVIAGRDGGVTIGAAATTLPGSGNLAIAGPQITAGSGTGVTLNQAGLVGETVYKITVDRTQFIAAAVTADFTVATLPAKTFVRSALIDLTQAFACTATCTSSTLSATLGKTAGGNQYLVSFDADAAAGQFGDAAAELGASLTPASVPTLNGDLASWTTTTAVVLRMTSGTGNIGTGTATNFSQGAMTVYLTTVKMP